MLPSTLDWLQEFYPAAHNALQQQYDYTIALGTNTVDWQLLFDDLFAAMVSWAAIDRSPLLPDITNSVYSYILVGVQFGYATSLSAYQHTTIFSMNDLFAAIISRSVSYYDDIVYNGGTFSWQSAKIVADLATIAGSPALETTRQQEAVALSSSLSQYHVSKVLYDTPQPLPVAVVSRESIRDTTFDTLGYKLVYTHLNVGSLVLPVGLP